MHETLLRSVMTEMSAMFPSTTDSVQVYMKIRSDMRCARHLFEVTVTSQNRLKPASVYLYDRTLDFQTERRHQTPTEPFGPRTDFILNLSPLH